MTESNDQTNQTSAAIEEQTISCPNCKAEFLMKEGLSSLAFQNLTEQFAKQEEANREAWEKTTATRLQRELMKETGRIVCISSISGIAGNFGSGWLDHSGLSENSLWFGGEVQQLGSPMHIERTSHAPLTPWRLDSEDDRVSLRFAPRQLHKACPKIGPFHANTVQHFGHFTGVLRGPKVLAR